MTPLNCAVFSQTCSAVKCSTTQLCPHLEGNTSYYFNSSVVRSHRTAETARRDVTPIQREDWQRLTEAIGLSVVLLGLAVIINSKLLASTVLCKEAGNETCPMNKLKASGECGHRSHYLSHAKRALYHLSKFPSKTPCLVLKSDFQKETKGPLLG